MPLYVWFVIWAVGFTITIGYGMKSWELHNTGGNDVPPIGGTIIISALWPLILLFFVAVLPFVLIGEKISELEFNSDQKKLLAKKQALLIQEQARKEIAALERELNLLKE